MAENLAIPPIPDDRPGKYEWITKMVGLGFSVRKACAMAGVPTITYYRLGRKPRPETTQDGAA